MPTLDEVNEYKEALDEKEREKIVFESCDFGYQQMIEDMIAYLKGEQKWKVYFKESHSMYLIILMELLEDGGTERRRMVEKRGYQRMIEDLINYLELSSEDREGWDKFNFKDAPRLKELLLLLAKELS